jgi:hypothetical protein
MEKLDLNNLMNFIYDDNGYQYILGIASLENHGENHSELPVLLQ